MTITRILALACCLSLSCIPCGLAQMSPVPKHRVGTPPSQVLKEILQTNLEPEAPRPLSNSGVKNLAPRITWLADSDPALSPNLILPSGSNSIYAVRNIANQLTTALGSVDYGIRVLHTPILLITATSGNDTIQSLLIRPEELPDATKQELHHLFTPFKELHDSQEKAPTSLAAQLKTLIETNIDYQVNLAVGRYQERIRAGRLIVVGTVLDTDNTYNHGKGRLMIININGESSTRQLQRHRVLNNISPSLLKCVGREIAQ